MVWVKRWGLVVLALAVVLPWLGEADVAIVGNEIVVPATSPERVMEGCTPKGKDLSPGADLRIGVKEKGDCDGTKQKFSPFLSNSAKLNYVAWFYKNCSVFDAYYEEEGKELTIKFEDDNAPYMIKGFLQGIRGMCTGEIRRITVPAQLAYGKFGAAYIPGNSTLVYEVQMGQINNMEDKGKVASSGFRQYP